MGEVNRQWLLKQRPQGSLRVDDFEYREAPVPTGELKQDEILVRNVAFLCAPTMRNWMGPAGQQPLPIDPARHAHHGAGRWPCGRHRSAGRQGRHAGLRPVDVAGLCNCCGERVAPSDRTARRRDLPRRARPLWAQPDDGLLWAARGWSTQSRRDPASVGRSRFDRLGRWRRSAS